MNLQKKILWRTADPQRLHIVCFHVHNILKIIKYRNGEQINGCNGLKVGVGGNYVCLSQGDMRVLVMEMCSVQLLSCVLLFATLWTSARQVSLTITNSQSLL